MVSEDVQVGENVRAARESAGYSQADVSRLMRAAGYPAFSPQAINRLEQGSRSLKLHEAGVLAQILNWPVTGFLPNGLMADLIVPVIHGLKRLEEQRGATLAARESYGRSLDAYRATRADVLAAWGPAAEALAGLDDDTEDAATLRVLQERVQRAEAETVERILDNARPTEGPDQG